MNIAVEMPVKEMSIQKPFHRECAARTGAMRPGADRPSPLFQAGMMVRTAAKNRTPIPLLAEVLSLASDGVPAYVLHEIPKFRCAR